MNAVPLWVTQSTWDGVAILSGAHDNLIYSAVIDSNNHNGVYLDGAGTNANTLRRSTVLSNSLAGVAIVNGASSNSVGVSGNRSSGNWIAGNTYDGVYIAGSATAYNVVHGNRIGTNDAGDATLGNGGNGVALDAGTHGNVIGLTATERNVIAGNHANGVLLLNGAHDNWVQSNDIGTNRDYPITTTLNRPAGGSADYLALPNAWNGIDLIGAYTTTIGGYVGGNDTSNFILHNQSNGLYLTGTQHSLIGLNAIHDNGLYGVLLDGSGTLYNVISRTQIYSNTWDGIGERNGATNNTWSEVSVHDNGGLGIDKNASIDTQNGVDAPSVVIDSVNRQTGVVQGHVGGLLTLLYKVELYRVAPDPSGYGEGAVFVGRATPDGTGHWTITDPAPAGGCYTAFESTALTLPPFVYASSEFSANTCRTFLPLARR